MLLVLWSMLPGCRPEAGVDTAPAFHLDLVPVVAENQSPFAGVDQIDLVVGVQGDAPQTLSLDAPGAGGSVTTGQIEPLEGDVIEVRAYSGGSLVAWGRSGPVELADGDAQAEVFVARLDEPAWLGALAPGLLHPVLGALGDGRFLLGGGATESATGGETSIDSGVDTLLTLTLSPPDGDLDFVAASTLPAYVDAQGRETHTARYGASFTPLTVGTDAGHLLLVGGSTAPGHLAPEDITADVQIYEPDGARWEALGAGAQLSTARVDHLAVPLDNGAVLVAGGWGNDGEGAGAPGTAEVYDPAARRFGDPFAADGVGMLDLAGAALGDEGAIACGGATVDLVAGTWRTEQGCAAVGADLLPKTGDVPDLPASLAGAAMLGLPNGKVLVTGGATQSTAADLDDAPASARDSAWLCAWPAGCQTTYRMSFPRAGHTMTLLPDGRVLIAGGAASYHPLVPPDDATSCLEIYDPDDGSYTLVPAGCAATGDGGGLPVATAHPTVALDPEWGALIVGGATSGSGGSEASTGVTLFVPPPKEEP